MARAQSVVAAALLLAFVGACSMPVTTTPTSVTIVDHYPSAVALSQDGVDTQARLGPFLKIVFESDPRLEALAARRSMQMGYEFFACDAPDQYVHTGAIFAEESGRYAAYVPALASQLRFWVTGGGYGQLGRGWPEELANESLCFRIWGGVPYEMGLRDRVSVLERGVNRMLDFAR